MTNTKNQPLLLIVDDIPENLKILGNIFREENFQIAIAANGKRALAMAQAKIPDVILLDVQMPEMDGFEVCQILKATEATKDIPVLFLTAKNSQEDILHGFELGAVDYIPKPFNHQELIARVRTHIELKQAREQAENYASELKELVATKDRFFNIIAHDLISPFNAILGFTDSLKKEAATIDRGELQLFANLLRETAYNSYRLVQNLLEWSRLQTKKMSYEPQMLSVSEIIEEAIKPLHGQAISKRIAIKINASIPLQVFADSYMLSTVIRNLVSNAIKFSNSETTITVSAYPGEENTIISIADQGVGIRPETREHLFDLTANHSTKGTENENGTGLGLLLCKEIIDRHKGKIWCESEPGRGTTFSISLPAGSAS
jgi:signal transduction histidine kinase